MRSLVVAKGDPVANHAVCMLGGFKAVPVHALLLQPGSHVPPFRSKAKPLSERSRNSRSTRPIIPKRLIEACSSAAGAVLASPCLLVNDASREVRGRGKSMISAKETQLSFQSRRGPNLSIHSPAGNCEANAERRLSLGGVAAERTVSMRAHSNSPLANLPTPELKDPLNSVFVESHEPGSPNEHSDPPYLGRNLAEKACPALNNP